MPDYDPLTISDDALKALSPAERGAVYKARAAARAAGNLAAGAPAARKAEVDALLATLSAGDLNVANTARRTAEAAQRNRESMKQLQKMMPQG